MNVIKTEPDSSSDSSLSGSQAADENSEEDSLVVMLPDVKLETEVRYNLSLLYCRGCLICFRASLLNFVCGVGNGKILSACRHNVIQHAK